jgi:hypothetical protein
VTAVSDTTHFDVGALAFSATATGRVVTAITAAADNGAGAPRFTTGTPHGFVIGSRVNIFGSPAVAAYDSTPATGQRVVTAVPDATHFDVGALAFTVTTTRSVVLSVDTDGDGCTDSAEIGSAETAGGQRHPGYFWDYWDVGSNRGTSAKLDETLAVDGKMNFDDVLIILDHFGDDATYKTIVSVADNGAGKARFQTSAPHLMTVLTTPYIFNSTVPAYNGTWAITVPDSTHFDVAALAFAGTATANAIGKEPQDLWFDRNVRKTASDRVFVPAAVPNLGFSKTIPLPKVVSFEEENKMTFDDVLGALDQFGNNCLGEQLGDNVVDITNFTTMLSTIPNLAGKQTN